jgi:protein ImuB
MTAWLAVFMFCCLVSSQSGVASILESVARACSPRVALYAGAAVFDVSGCSRTIGSPEVIGREVVQLAAAKGLTPQVAVAATTTTAWLLAHARRGPTVALAGAEAATLAALPLRCLETLLDLDRETPALHSSRSPRDASHLLEAYRAHLAIFERWGLRTLGDIAALPRRDVHARMGPIGVHLHQAACGEATRPFAAMDEAQPFLERLELEWPIDGLEPLAFVLARLCERLSARLEQADRGAVVLCTRARLVTRVTHERVLRLPAPIRDARVLRTLILLDLESHPPPAAIDVVELELDVAPGRIVHGSLIAVPLPAAEDLTTLVARLGALMGDTRIGAPALVDTYDARVVGMMPFHLPKDKGEARRARLKSGATPASQSPLPSVRRLRLPIAARVVVENGAPVRVMPSARGWAGGAVVARSGPWRTSGAWWTFNRAAWDRDEWDVELSDGGIYRLARQRRTSVWEIEGILD